ncbi:MAG TPA: TIR domain-containing protein [Tepidisphaeraceae bacterium]|nr:TIR domain-containing protein [Tepidisphaeraceae bacterium]
MNNSDSDTPSFCAIRAMFSRGGFRRPRSIPLMCYLVGMEALEKRYLYRRLTFTALHAIVTEFLRLTDRPGSGSLQTYRLSDERSSVTYNALLDLAAQFDNYDQHYLNITGGDGCSLQMTRIATMFIYQVSGTSDVITEIVAKLDTALNQPESLATDPVIFIGHGRKSDWKSLRDHLVYEQKFKVEFFESESRAGGSIRSVLEAMQAKSGCAILVYTGEDKLEDGQLRPRPNVIHECGFFTAGLGEGRTFVLKERGVEVPTNQAGEIYIEYPVGSIETVFGQVIAAIRQLVPRA